MIRATGQRLGRSSRRDVGFSGYSRTNAGAYHERMATTRSRLRVLVTIALALGLLALLACGLNLVFSGGLG